MPHAKRGFTLIELIVVATIIAVLTALGAVSYASANKRSRDAKRQSDLEQMRSALEMFRTDNGHYPTGSCSTSYSDLSCLSAGAEPLGTAYISALPADPQSPNKVYRFQLGTLSGGYYYSYCLSAYLESQDPSDSCNPDTAPEPDHNYGLKNP